MPSCARSMAGIGYARRVAPGSRLSRQEGARPGHACLVVSDPGDYERRLADLREAGVEITHEHQWDGGRRSFYFRDPAGNLLELADGDLWPE